MKIGDEVKEVLERSEITNEGLRLPEQLDRKLYVNTDNVLKALGVKWNRKAKQHLFTGIERAAFEERIGLAVETGAYESPRDYDFFETPESLAFALVECAEVEKGMHCLEPSAGHGRIALELAKIVGTERVQCAELHKDGVDILYDHGFSRVWWGDFLLYQTVNKFDRIVMNPPFSKQQDIDHVLHAWSMLAPGGILVAVMASGVTFRGNKKTKNFHETLRGCCEIEPLPEKTFRVSGTDVNTVVVTARKE